MKNEIILEVKNLKKYFNIAGGMSKKHVCAVDNVSFTIPKGQTMGLVGESGCGKSTLGRTIIRLYEPTAGNILYAGKAIEHLNKKEMIPYREKMQMIFQDPFSSLDARMLVRDIISEGMPNNYSKKEKNEKVLFLLNKVGLNQEYANRFPHEFSGGQRQRVGIARALATDPEFIICDEPISALDVSIQAQVINMLEDLQKELGLTYLFIAHDLSMVKHISSKVGVMYLGRIIESGNNEDLYNNPLHPYTQALLSAILIPDPMEAEKSTRIILEGEVPSPINIPKGCRFKGRCRYVKPQCKESEPEMVDVGNGHYVACFLIK
jgi:oligopeptide transport system ATP-binding protein